MVVQDPRQFVETYLSLPPGSNEPSPPPPENSWVGGRSGYPWRGAGKGAKTATIQFLKQRVLPRQEVYAVTFEDETGHMWDYFCTIAQDEQGFWHLMAAASVIKGAMRRATHTFPWIHLVGGSGDSYLWAGGYVTDKALDAQLVRLITKNGVVLEDIVENGLVLFQTNQQVEVPARLEVYARSGELIGAQALFNWFGRS